MVETAALDGRDLWPRCYAFVRGHEGGFSNHPSDPGGATYAGVSLRAVVGLDVDGDGRFDFDLDRDGDVDADDIRSLKAEPGKVETFYRSRYFAPVRAWEMKWPWCLLAFDAAVQHGPLPAALLIQRAVDSTADGTVGPNTVKAVALASPWAVRAYFIERHSLYARISIRRALRARERGLAPDAAQHEGEVFLRGWYTRMADLDAEARRPA